MRRRFPTEYFRYGSAAITSVGMGLNIVGGLFPQYVGWILIVGGLALLAMGFVPTRWKFRKRIGAMFAIGIGFLLAAYVFVPFEAASKSQPFWARLQSADIKNIAEDLKTHGQHDVRILVCPSSDCGDLGDDFATAFAKAGWRIPNPTTPLSSDYKGLHVSITKESQGASHILRDVLRRHGYEVEFWGDPDHQTTEGTTTVWLLIGVKGHPDLPASR